MVSLAVRCTPETCFKAVMRYGFDNFDVEDTIDANTTILRGRFPGSLFAAPREALLLRTWRRDVDGSFIILCQDHEATSCAGRGGRIAAAPRGVVQAHVAAFGFIIAPVSPEYLPPGAQRATECLVTTVAKVDAGGWLSRGCVLGRLLGCSPLATYTTDAWLRPLVQRVITLRDVVEQERFIRKPFECALSQTNKYGSQDLSRSRSDAALSVWESAASSGMGISSAASGSAAAAAGGGAALGPAGQPKPGPSAVEVRAASSLGHRGSRGPDSISLPLDPPHMRRMSVSYSFQPAHIASPSAGSPSVGPLRSPLASPGISGSVDDQAADAAAAAVMAAEMEQRAWAGGTLPADRWSDPGCAGWKIRGPNYLQDRRKIAASPSVFALASVDIVRSQRPAEHIGRFLPSIRYSEAPFTFTLNVMVPANPPLSLVVSWAADYMPDAEPSAATGKRSVAGSTGSADNGPLVQTTSGCSTNVVSSSQVNGGDEDDYGWDSEAEEASGASPFDRCLARFLAGTNEQRDAAFKLIPRISEGSWVIKQSVGTTPVILGRKLNTKYFRGKGYFEVDIDIGSSSVAASVVSLVQGATRSLVIDMAVLFEGKQQDELPEQLLGVVRLDHMDLGAAPWLDVETGRVTQHRPTAL